MSSPQPPDQWGGQPPPNQWGGQPPPNQWGGQPPSQWAQPGPQPALQPQPPMLQQQPPLLLRRSPAENVPPRERYQLAARAQGAKWWRGLIALLLFGAAFFVAQILFIVLLSLVALATGRQDWIALDGGMTPALLLTTNISLAALIPVSILIERLVFKLPPGQISSVTGRIRWRWLGLGALVAAPIWALWIGLGSLGSTWADDLGATAVAFTLIIVLTTPFQAAGEEYGFRGLITRSVAMMIPNRRVALVVAVLISSALFMAAHAAGDPWLNTYYFTLGVTFAIITFRTGGLELAIVLHVINNVFSMLIATFTGQMDQAFERSVGAGSPVLLLGPVLTLVVLAVAELIARRRGRLQVRTAPEPVGTGIAGRTGASAWR